MLTNLLLESLTAPSESLRKSMVRSDLITKYNIENSRLTADKNKLYERILTDVSDNIIRPLITNSSEDLEQKINQSILSFELKFESMNRIIFRNLNETDIQELFYSESKYFDDVMGLIKVNEKLQPQSREKIYEIITRLRDYDLTIFGFVRERYDQFMGALKIVNIEVLRRYVSTLVLAVFCILALISADGIDESKLEVLRRIFTDKFAILEAFVNSIDTLGDKEKVLPAVIENQIGFQQNDRFFIDSNKMELGKRYLIKYDTSSYEAEVNEHGELVFNEIG
jgi:hypothetical protein